MNMSPGRSVFEPLEPRLLLSGTAEEQALELFSVSPALFVENQGQWADETVRYVHQGSGANVAMTDTGPVFQVFREVPCEGAELAPGETLEDPFGLDRFDSERPETEVLQFSASFVGANSVTPVGLEQSETVFNYFVGGEEDWRSEVPAYEQVAYQGLYDGIDLVTWGQRDSLKYEFRVAPGADYTQIQVTYDGIAGLSLADDGSLLVDLGEGWGSLTDDAPYIYQVVDGEQVDVAGRFVLLDEWTYSFEVTGGYDPSQTLVIDPDLTWNTYLDGSLPNPASGSYTTLLAADLLGGIYACDGDSLYKYNGSAFSPLYSGIVAAGGAPFDPSALAVSADGSAAYVASGYSGKVVRIDLAGATPAAAGLANAALPSGSNFGLAVDPIYGQLFISDSWTQSLYLVDSTGAGAVTLLDNFSGTGWAGGGIAFTPTGELFVPVPTSYSVWPTDDEFTVDLYQFSRSWLDSVAAGTASTGAGQLYATGVVVSGSGSVAADAEGHIYLTGADAIYGINTAGNLTVVAGDTTLNAWDMYGYGFMGLAYDAKEDRLVTGYAASAGDPFELTGIAPVPADLGDTLKGSADLGMLASGAPVVRTDQVGNGAYGTKDVDLYKFALSSSGTVALDVDGQAIGSGLDAYLRLFNASGQELKKDDDTNGRDPYISTYLSPGTYYVGVSGYANRYYNPTSAGSGIAGSTGPYTLTVSLAGGGGGGGTWSPTITVSATYDGDPSASVFGRYLTGSVVPDLLNTFTAYVSAPTGFTTSAVMFDANFDGVRDAGDWTDSYSTGGWTWDLNVSDLVGDKTLRIWAQELGGAWSDAALFTIDTLAAPSWMAPDLTTITFSSGTYRIDSLIGERFGVETPSFFPDFLEGTWNGVYAGISVQADMSLSGQVTTRSVAPTVGYSFLGFEQAYRFNLGTSFSRTYSLSQIISLFKDPAGYFDSSGGSSGLTNPQTGGPTVTLSYSGQVALNNNLQFGQFNASFGMTLASASGSQFTLNLPKTIFPIPGTFGILSLDLTPHLGWSPSFDVGFQIALGGGGPVFQSASLSVGATGYVGVTGEVSVLGGAASGGVDITGSLG
ncbi:MAG TPA: pre-peptidase C-terminal domain-containing protein, partial [Phycisphaerae bacterium]|nr:pre-peptidase C-terminal domain-containing protein [Phycisphaerae bacterium]